MKTMLSTIPSIPARTKKMVLVSTTCLIALGLSGCSALGIESKFDKSATHDFATGAEGKEKGVLPVWVPDEVTDVKEIVRSTGNERILTMQYTGSLPAGCAAMTTPGQPTVSELSAGLNAEEPTDPQDLANMVASQYQTPLLSADWWPTGQETRATNLCGKWWVSQESGSVYAYSPEDKGIANQVLSEQATAQR